MTSDPSIKNLIKFLKSDDPALIRMGLSIAKGAGAPDPILPKILELYMWHENQKIRSAARFWIFKHAPEELQRIVNQNWKGTYRQKVLSGIYFDSVKYLSPLIEPLSYDDKMVEAVLHPFTKKLSDNNSNTRWQAAMILGEIGDKRAIRYLVEALQDDDEKVRTNVTQALQKLGHEVEE